MISLKKSIPFSLIFMLGLIFLSILLNACQESTPASGDINEIKPIKDSEIIAFQKAYGISFNAISKAIEGESYYESAARKHIDQNYNYDEGKVMFKIGNDEEVNT